MGGALRSLAAMAALSIVSAAVGLAADEADVWFPFEPMVDEFRPTLLDCSSLVDAPTGLHGFVRVEGDDFVFEDGKPARFFGVEIEVFPRGQMEYAAKRLRKLGVNAVRLRGLGFLNAPNAKSVLDYEAEAFDRLDYAVAQLGDQGIYVILDVHDPATLRFGPGDLVPGLPQGGTAPGAEFFDPKAARLVRQRMRDVLMHRNTYTGKRYAEDATLALVELAHEDSLFRQGAEGLNEALRAELERSFTEWLRKRYRDAKGLAKAWDYVGQSPLGKGEGLDQKQRVGLLPMSEFTEEALAKAPVKRRRAQDQLRFLLELEETYWQASREALRQAGVRAPIAASNWAGSGLTTRIHLYGESKLDYVDQHGFWDPPEGQGDQKARIATCLFHDLPMVKEASSSSRAPFAPGVGNLVMVKAWQQVIGLPVTVSQWNTCLPNEHSLEGPGLLAAYGSMQGWDALIEYGYLSPVWRRRLSESPFDLLGNPAQILQFPAAALLWHRQDVKEARLVAETLYGFDDLFALANDAKPLPPEAALIGRVGYRFTPSPRVGVSEDVMRHWDPKTLTTRSITGDLIWNAGDGLVTVDTARSQAAIGFLAPGPRRLSNMMVTTDIPFGAVWLTAVDGDKPIVEATRLLITAVGPARNTGMEYERTAEPVPDRDATYWRLKSEGSGPLMMQAVQGEVRVLSHQAERLKAWALDLNGKRRVPIEVVVEANFVRVPISGAYRTCYYELAVE